MKNCITLQVGNVSTDLGIKSLSVTLIEVVNTDLVEVCHTDWRRQRDGNGLLRVFLHAATVRRVVERWLLVVDVKHAHTDKRRGVRHTHGV